MQHQSNPKVTVLMTVYNGLPYLKHAIESTLNQTFTDYEFLIIDDTSTDDSINCILSYIDPRIILIKNEVNIGQTASLNRGLAIAKGEYIARLDQDDVNLPSRLEGQLEMFIKNPQLSIVCSWEHTIDSEGRLVRDWRKEIRDYGVFLGEILLGLCPVWHPSVMFKKEVIQNLGGYDKSYGPAEDYELWSRIAIAGLNAGIVSEFHLLQRVHGNRQSYLQATKQIESTRRAHIKVIKNLLISPYAECTAAILRLEKDPCGQKYTKSHLLEISSHFSLMLKRIKENYTLSEKEYNSLKVTISRRAGNGIFYAKKLEYLPDPLFFFSFYFLSPFLSTRLRFFVSSIIELLHRMRYFYKI